MAQKSGRGYLGAVRVVGDLGLQLAGRSINVIVDDVAPGGLENRSTRSRRDSPSIVYSGRADGRCCMRKEWLVCAIHPAVDWIRRCFQII